jgi:hypothetical protein
MYKNCEDKVTKWASLNKKIGCQKILIKKK